MRLLRELDASRSRYRNMLVGVLQSACFWIKFQDVDRVALLVLGQHEFAGRIDSEIAWRLATSQAMSDEL